MLELSNIIFVYWGRSTPPPYVCVKRSCYLRFSMIISFAKWLLRKALTYLRMLC